jgi:hypothetical protein
MAKLVETANLSEIDNVLAESKTLTRHEKVHLRYFNAFLLSAPVTRAAYEAFSSGDHERFLRLVEDIKNYIKDIHGKQTLAECEGTVCELGYAYHSIFMSLLEEKNAQPAKDFLKWMCGNFPMWKLNKLVAHIEPAVDALRNNDAEKIDLWFKYCWHSGMLHIAYRSILSATGDTTVPSKLNIEMREPQQTAIPDLSARSRTLFEKFKNVPPEIMKGCQPGGDRTSTFGAISTVLGMIDFLTSGNGRQQISDSQLNDYIHLICQHDRSLTFQTLMSHELHPALPNLLAVKREIEQQPNPDVQERMSEENIARTEKFRSQMSAIANKFGAKHVELDLKHWPEYEMQNCLGIHRNVTGESYSSSARLLPPSGPKFNDDIAKIPLPDHLRRALA